MQSDDNYRSDEKRDWEPRESSPVPLPPQRRRERISEVTTGAHRRDAIQSAIEAVIPKDVALSAMVLAAADLERRIAPEMDEEEILQEYLATFAGLFEGRRFVVRLLGEGGTVDLLRCTAPMNAGRPEELRVSCTALLRCGVNTADARIAGLEVVDAYQPEFGEGAQGFDVLLRNGNTPIGVLGVEVPPGSELPETDGDLVRLLALQLGSALARARLNQEASYLSSYLARLLDHANVPILVIDRRRRIQVVSQAVLDITGLRRDQVVGREFSTLVVDSEKGRLLPAVISSLRGRAMEHFEVALASRDGSPVRLSINLVSLLNPQGEVEGVIAIGQDLTEVRRLESQIIHAEKLATLGQLAAGVVHELNNPLTSISVYSEYLHSKGVRENAPKGDVEKLSRIVQNADRILRFTRDLVTYARPSNEEPRALDLGEILDQATVFCEHVLSDASAVVVREDAAELPRVLGVRGQLHQVFINLITNACHAMPDGAGKLEIRSNVGPKYLEVRISDNGAGIAEEELERIFEPFFSTKGEGKGTGLGLSIVRNIVHQHGGKIHAECGLGQGATFVVRLPRPAAPASQLPRRNAS